MHVKGYIILNTTFGAEDNSKLIKVRYLVIDAPSPCNMIIGQPTFNQLMASLYTLYLCIKYSHLDGWVRVIQGNQDIVGKCYVKSLDLKKIMVVAHTQKVVT